MKRKGKSERKVFTSVTKGNRMSFRPGNHSKKLCGHCGSLLSGIKRIRAIRLGKTFKSKKRVNRKFGGSLCSLCSREKIVESTRKT
jgi:large subunit ribosomal protein L34e